MSTTAVSGIGNSNAINSDRKTTGKLQGRKIRHLTEGALCVGLIGGIGLLAVGVVLGKGLFLIPGAGVITVCAVINRAQEKKLIALSERTLKESNEKNEALIQKIKTKSKQIELITDKLNQHEQICKNCLTIIKNIHDKTIASINHWKDLSKQLSENNTSCFENITEESKKLLAIYNKQKQKADIIKGTVNKIWQEQRQVNRKIQTIETNLKEIEETSVEFQMLSEELEKTKNTTKRLSQKLEKTKKLFQQVSKNLHILNRFKTELFTLIDSSNQKPLPKEFQQIIDNLNLSTGG